MFFTFAGRIQTRLLSLIAPGALLCALSLATGDAAYAGMFALMAALGLLLDAVVYGWLIGYQPRWVTIALGALEFGLLLGMMRALAPSGVAIDGWRAFGLYAPAWLLAWLTTSAALPWLFPRWAEDGGELRPATAPARRRPGWDALSLAARRTVFARAALALGLLLLPWLAAELARAGRVFTGLLLLEPLHLAEIARATRPAPGLSPADALGDLARLAGWDPLALYYLLWPLAAFALLLATLLYAGAGRWRAGAALGGIAALLLPATWLLVAAALAWTLVVWRWAPQAGQTHRWRWLPAAPVRWRAANLALAWPLLTLAVLLWGAAWARVFDPACYLDEGRWRAAAWLRDAGPPGAIAVAPGEPAVLLAAFGGREIVPSGAPAALRMTSGTECASLDARFWHSDICLLES
jgi:hypothetical protein